MRHGTDPLEYNGEGLLRDRRNDGVEMLCVEDGMMTGEEAGRIGE